MLAGEGANLRKAWDGKSCSHSSLEKEYYQGSKTGWLICSVCGKTFATQAANENLSTTYAQALELVADARPSLFQSATHPRPDLEIDDETQTQLLMACAAMMLTGRGSGDYSYEEFERPINFRKITSQSIEWLEKSGVPARRAFAPLATEHYNQLLGHKTRLPVSTDNIGRFFSRWIHYLLVEAQIILAKQYYHGLGLYKPRDGKNGLEEMSNRGFPPEILKQFEQASANQIYIDQLHGRIFLEYCAVMIRAQWDKLTRLSCIVFGLKEDWDSIAVGLRLLEKKLLDTTDLHPWCREHLQSFRDICHERVDAAGWLKRFRDPLLHDVGQHSAGVLPRKKSIYTTSEMWDRVRDEHDWLREGTLAALISYMYARPA